MPSTNESDAIIISDSDEELEATDSQQQNPRNATFLTTSNEYSDTSSDLRTK